MIDFCFCAPQPLLLHDNLGRCGGASTIQTAVRFCMRRSVCIPKQFDPSTHCMEANTAASGPETLDYQRDGHAGVFSGLQGMDMHFPLISPRSLFTSQPHLHAPRLCAVAAPPCTLFPGGRCGLSGPSCPVACASFIIIRPQHNRTHRQPRRMATAVKLPTCRLFPAIDTSSRPLAPRITTHIVSSPVLHDYTGQTWRVSKWHGPGAGSVQNMPGSSLGHGPLPQEMRMHCCKNGDVARAGAWEHSLPWACAPAT